MLYLIPKEAEVSGRLSGLLLEHCVGERLPIFCVMGGGMRYLAALYGEWVLCVGEELAKSLVLWREGMGAVVGKNGDTTS